jgi:hypothetical protein
LVPFSEIEQEAIVNKIKPEEGEYNVAFISRITEPDKIREILNKEYNSNSNSNSNSSSSSSSEKSDAKSGKKNEDFDF